MTSLRKQAPAPPDHSTRNPQSGRFARTVARIDEFGIRICSRHDIPMVPCGPRKRAFRCSVCAQERSKKWEAEHYDEVIRKRREYYAANRDRILANKRDEYTPQPRQLRLPHPRKMATCHPDRVHCGKGLCKQCYDREYRRRHLAEHNAACLKWTAKHPEYKSVIHRKSRYGISPEECAQMYARQDGRCAICRVGPAEHLDHDHTTKQNRALLCGNCNRGLGLFKDNPDFLARAILYLSKGTIQ